MAQTDRDILLVLHRCTDGANWKRSTNWGTDAHLSRWYGVEVNNQGRVVKLSLDENNLRGPIPPELGYLAALKELDLSENKLTGAIPAQLGSLAWLDLSSNQLCVKIPASLGQLSMLQKLLLNRNRLTGPIPKELGALTKLEVLRLDNNELTGPIPPELGKLSALQTLHLIVPILGHRKLTGPVPPELGKLAALQNLVLHNNELSGAIPAQLGDLNKLMFLALAKNQLSGPIPSELGKLGALKELSLWRNKLSGAIPAQLGDLNNLTLLNLSDNQLSGTIPPELGKLAALQTLSLRSNNLTGPIPPEVGNLGVLKELLLSNNHLTGHIPPQLGGLRALKYLYLDSNKLDGPIPAALGALSKLERLYLSGNQLTGAIPAQLGDLNNLTWLDLTSNQLSGSIPSELGKLAALQRLSLSNNQLTALWDHSSNVDRDEELLQGRAGGDSVPGELGKFLARLSNIEGFGTLSITPNPWKEPPEAVVKKGMAAVSEYFADLFAEGVTVQRNMIKVVLVGQEGAGKTSLRQSIRTGRPTRTRGSAESTVQFDVEEIDMDVDSVSLRVYDCAGQVAYTGLLQMFLSPRAVVLLVCNAAAFGQRDDCSSDSADQLTQDLEKLEELRVCGWLRSLSFRIPDSDVVVVATKCDLARGMAASLAGRMERAVRQWQKTCSELNIQSVRVEKGVCLTSCAAILAPAEQRVNLARRMMRAFREWLETWHDAEMAVVRAEDGVSLTSIIAHSALEERAEDASSARRSAGEVMWACDWREGTCDDFPPGLLHRVVYNSNGGLRGAAMVLPRSWSIALEVLDALASGRDPVESVNQKIFGGDRSAGGREPATKAKKHKSQGLTLAELDAEWRRVVEALKGDGKVVINPDHAMKGALLIREHEGSLVRHETFVFLDVTWLAKILKPLLNHREKQDPLRGSISLGDTDIMLDDAEHVASWRRFKARGILEPMLARALWPDGLSEYVLPTLGLLGLAHPLDGESAKGLVVLLRLGEKQPPAVREELEGFSSQHKPVLQVTWKVSFGVPPGAIEKVLVRCCSIGELRTFWRFGVLVQGSFGGVSAGKTFAMLVEYSQGRKEITMKVYGNIGTAAPWAALCLGVSASLTMCSEFPGLPWHAFLKCPEHVDEDMQINNKATKPGDRLLLENSCCSRCSRATGGLGAAAMDLLLMTDVRGGEVFQETHERFLEVQQRYPVLVPEASRALHPERAQRQFDTWLNGVKQEVEGVFRGAKAAEAAKLERLVGDLQKHLEKSQEHLREWIASENKLLVDAIDADDGVMGRLDFVVAMLMALRSEEVDVPRQACILPPWDFHQAHGLSEREQSPAFWAKQLEEWQEGDFKEGKRFFMKEKRLFLVCAQTLRLVPCGPNGHGYDVQQPRTWVRRSAKVATFALQVACTTLTAIAAVPLSGAGAVAEAAVTAAMDGFESKLQGHLEGLTPDDDGTDAAVRPQATQREEVAYASLREFVHGVEDTARLKIAKARKKAQKERRAPPRSSEFVFFADQMARVQRRDGDASVQWVLKGREDAWYDATRSAPKA